MAIVDKNGAFSALEECDYIGWISGETLDNIVINFYSGSAAEIQNVYAYLYSGKLKYADVTCEPYFPALVRVDEEHLPENQDGFRRIVTFTLESGTLSFFYESVSFNKSTKSVVPFTQGLSI